MNFSTKQRIEYAIGGFGKNIAYGLVSSYTLYYYNTVLGVSASFIGVLLMVARIFDAFNDPIMGAVVEKTRSKYGKYKPWIVSGALLNAVIMHAMFACPDALVANGGVKAYVTILYFLCGITYTLTDIPFWAVIPAFTKPGDEREKLTLYARTMGGIGVAIPTITVMAIVPLLGGGEDMVSMKRGFMYFGFIISIIYVITTFVAIKPIPTKEIYETKDASLKELFAALFKNDYALVLAAVIILFNSAFNLTTNIALYIYEYDIGSKAQYTIFTAVCGIAQFLAMVVIYPALRKKNSNRNIFLIACITGVAGYLLLLLLTPIKTLTTAILLVVGLLVSLSNGVVYVQTTIFVAGAVDYGQKKTGKRQDGMVSSLQTLMVKFASAISVLIAGIGIDLCRLVQTDGAVQARSSIIGLRLVFSVPGLILTALAFIIFWKKKQLGEDVEI